MQLNQIGQLAIHADDLARAVAFYRDTLGMRFLFHAPNIPFFDCRGTRIMLDAVKENVAERITSMVYYKVPDINAAHDELVSKGVTFVSKPHLIAKLPDHDLWMGFFRDS